MFKAQACRPRSRAASEQRTSVGNWGPGLKGWEVSRMQRPFDGPVVYNVEVQEALLDWTFDRLAITGGHVVRSRAQASIWRGSFVRARW